MKRRYFVKEHNRIIFKSDDLCECLARVRKTDETGKVYRTADKELLAFSRPPPTSYGGRLAK